MSHINSTFIKKLRKDYHQREEERKRIIEESNQLLHASKRVIFALHREGIKGAQDSFQKIEKGFQDLEKKFGFKRLTEEGSFKAAAEEYAEAKMFFKILNGEKLDKTKEVNLPLDSYLGGMCDLVGELVRLATNRASSGRMEEVKQIKTMISEIMEELIQFDFTGYLRNKYDQAKTGLRKIEQMDYEINLKSQ